jgi:sugar-specific transcriptional regulator TrmB
MNNGLLEKLGMNKKEIKLYLKLLELGSSRANILAKCIGENRTSTYSLLNAMLKKGLVNFYKKTNIKYYSATSPRILIEGMKDDASQLMKMLPELLAITNQYAEKPRITFYEGVEGIKQIAKTMLEVPGSVRYSFMGVEKKKIHPEMMKYIDEEFLPRRIKKGINFKGIVSNHVPMSKQLPNTEEGHLRELKYIDPKKFPLKIHVDVYEKNKVAIFSYHKDEMMGVIIEHESFYQTMKTVFQLAWNGIG